MGTRERGGGGAAHIFVGWPSGRELTLLRLWSASIEKCKAGKVASGLARYMYSVLSTSKRMRTVLWLASSGITMPCSTDISPARYCTAGPKLFMPA